MKPLRLSYLLVAIGILVFTCSTLFGASITTKLMDLSGSYKTNKITAHVLNNLDTQGNNYFTLENMKYLEDHFLRGTDIAYTSEDKAAVSYKNTLSEAGVFGVSSKYINFHQIQLKSGSFITPGSKNVMAAVVDEKLAQTLFNNDNIVGMDIELYNRKFKIIGMIKKDGSIVQTLSDSGYGTIYIPIEDMLEQSEDSRITSLEIKTTDTGTTGKNISDLNKALASIGKNISNYKVIDYNIEKILISEKSKLTIFISGLGAVILLLLSIKEKIKGIYTAVKSNLKEKYLKDVLKLGLVNKGMTLLEILILIIFAYFIYKTVRFSLYILPEYIPDELINTVFFSDLFKDMVRTGIQNAGYTALPQEIQLNVLRTIENWNFFIDILIGFPLFYLGLYHLKVSGDKTIKAEVYCSIFLILSVMLGLFILTILKMPLVINLKGLLIVFIFIYLSAAHICSNKKV